VRAAITRERQCCDAKTSRANAAKVAARITPSANPGDAALRDQTSRRAHRAVRRHGWLQPIALDLAGRKQRAPGHRGRPWQATEPPGLCRNLRNLACGYLISAKIRL
jgi:hypothetical protein